MLAGTCSKANELLGRIDGHAGSDGFKMGVGVVWCFFTFGRRVGQSNFERRLNAVHIVATRGILV